MSLPAVLSWSEEAPGASLEGAARVLAAGGIVAHPTETVYGLAADARRADAYDRLLRIKGGRTPRAFLLLFDTTERLLGCVGELPPGGDVLARRFWPGPLTLLVPAAAGLPPWWSGPEGDVAARVSPHPFCRALVDRLGGPVLSTSANAAGQPPLTDAGAIAAALAGRGLDLVVDGGTLAGTPSTLLRWTEDGWSVQRPGPVRREELERTLAEGASLRLVH